MKKLFNLLKESQHMDYRRLNIGEEDLDDTKMTNEEKRAFVEAVASYRKIGEAIYHNGNLMEAYQNIKKIVETAHKLTLQETGDWFDKVTVSRHMKSMNESFKIFTNTIKEVSTLQQRLESSYDEIGEILGKYYEIKEGNEFGAERAKAIAAGEDTFRVGDKTFKVTDVDSEDKENAQNFIGENMKLSKLINKKSINEGKNLVKEIAIRKGTRIRSYIDGRTYTVDYEVVDTKHFSLRYGGGRTNLLKVINSDHPKIKVGSTEEFSTGDLKKSISAGIKTIIKESYIGEAKKPKVGDTIHLKSQNKTGMVFAIRGSDIIINTTKGLVKGKLSDAEVVMDEGNEFGAERARAIAAGEDTFTVGGKTYKVTDVDPQDKENAKDFVGEMKLSNFIKKGVKKSINETKFYAFFNNKKHEIEGKDLWDAKQKAITMLKVPKSKVGYLAIVNAGEHDKGSFKYESENKIKLKEFQIDYIWKDNQCWAVDDEWNWTKAPRYKCGK